MEGLPKVLTVFSIDPQMKVQEKQPIQQWLSGFQQRQVQTQQMTICWRMSSA